MGLCVHDRELKRVNGTLDKYSLCSHPVGRAYTNPELGQKDLRLEKVGIRFTCLELDESAGVAVGGIKFTFRKIRKSSHLISLGVLRVKGKRLIGALLRLIDLTVHEVCVG